MANRHISAVALHGLHKRAPFCLLVAVLSLTACSNEVRKQLGLERTAPDEFAVVRQAPLSLPPNYELRPPVPGAPRPQETAPRDQAAQQLFGAGAVAEAQAGAGTEAGSAEIAAESGVISAVPRTPVTAVSPGVAAILSQAGADQANPNIRQVVEAETSELVAASESFTDRLLFWRDPDEPGTVVDADAERRRLQENSALGQPPTTGETPQVERRQRALLEGLF